MNGCTRTASVVLRGIVRFLRQSMLREYSISRYICMVNTQQQAQGGETVVDRCRREQIVAS